MNPENNKLSLLFNLFMKGEVINYGELCVKLNTDKIIEIYSYVRFSNPPKKVTVEMAATSIAKSKEILADLCQASSSFEKVFSISNKHYYYCIDYHSGSQTIAKEIDEQLHWLG